MQNELPEDTGVRDERAEWQLGGWFWPQTLIVLGPDMEHQTSKRAV